MFKKRIVAFSLAVAMTAGGMAGCGLSDNKQTKESTVESTKPVKQKNYEITLFTTRMTPNPDSEVMKKITEKLGGHKLKVTSVADNEYNERMNLFFASNELPDIFGSNGQLTILQNATAKFTEDEFKTYMPGIYSTALKQYEMSGVSKEAIFSRFTVGGKLAGVTAGSLSMAYPYGIAVRKDMFDEAGVAVPKTLADWEAYFKIFKNKYPNKYPITAAGKSSIKQSFYVFMSAFGVSFDKWHLKDGKLVYAPFLPEMRDALALLQNWYKAGYINPEWVTMDSKAADNEWINGNNPYKQFVKVSEDLEKPGATTLQGQILAANPKAKFEYAPFPILKEGKKPAVEVYEAVTNAPMCFGNHLEKDKDKLYVVMSVADKLWSDEELYMLRNFGIEGVHYDISPDTKLPKARAEFSTNDAKNLAGIGWWIGALPGKSWEMELKFSPAVYVNNLKTLMEGDGIYSKKNVDYTFTRVNGALTSPSGEVLDTRANSKLEEWSRVFAEVIVGKKSLEDFDKFIADWKKEIGNELTESANRLYLKQWMK